MSVLTPDFCKCTLERVMTCNMNPEITNNLIDQSVDVD